MKPFSLSIIAFLTFAITCKAQWTPGTGIITTTNSVGIGTNTPASKLDVQGLLNIGAAMNIGAFTPATIHAGGSGNTTNMPYVVLENGTPYGGWTPLSEFHITSDGTNVPEIGWTTGGRPGNLLVRSYGTYGGGNINVQAKGIINFLSNDIQRMLIDNNGNVGIGTSSPLGVLDVKLTTNQHIQFAPNVNGGYSGASGIVSINDGNTGYTPLGFYASNYYFGGGNVGIATTDTKGYTFAVNGTAIATSITVKAYANWPDFVFKPTYKLPTLTEVKTYIDQNHHLPDVPSATEVEKNGLNLGEMNKVLVQKVEELTLYLIEQNKQVAEQNIQLIKQNTKLADQQKVNQSQQKQIDELKKSLNSMNHKKSN